MSDWSARGREFEQQERRGWEHGEGISIRNEAGLLLTNGRRGRIDILVELDDSWVVIETKSTVWDTIKYPRIRPNLRRHIRQLRKYIDAHIAVGEKVHPALVYPSAPKSRDVRQLIEDIADEAFVQVVWRDDESPRP